jgi:twitching motility two-component system response regulator PilH
MAKKVLVVDDEPSVVKMVVFRLKKEGLDVVIAQNGTEGLEKAKAETPDLILLDVTMPGMSGHEVLVKLKESAETKSIPVIMFTAKGQVEDVERSSREGAVDYIAKPYDPVTLLGKVKKALEG